MNEEKRVPLLNKVAYGLGTGGGCVFNQIAAAFLLNYYTDTAMIGAGAIATMFLLCRVLDGITDFAMGGIVDKTHTKLGKARPWLILSAPLTMLGIILLMNVPTGFSEGGKLVYAYLTYIFMNCIVYTIYGISNTALLPLMTRNAKDSTMLATFSALGNNIIGLIAGSCITPLVLNFGWTVASVVLGAGACILILISGLLNKEIGTGDDASAASAEEPLPMKEQLPAVLRTVISGCCCCWACSPCWSTATPLAHSCTSARWWLVTLCS
jgi:GPH family glycoside/pentoside/hexuronide:cation symporter